MCSTHSAEQLNDLPRMKYLVIEDLGLRFKYYFSEATGVSYIFISFPNIQENIGRIQIIAFQCSYFRDSSGTNDFKTVCLIWVIF